MEETLSILTVITDAIKNMTWVEIVAVLTGLIYVILAVRENILCWPFGIISSVLSIYLFYTGRLYADAVLYFYYVIAGIYGWYAWYGRASGASIGDNDTKAISIHTWPWKSHFMSIVLGVLLSFVLAFILKNYTDAEIPLLDSFTTIFSFIATYMVTRKILENWLYWIVIDIVATGMYFYKAYYLYALLMIIYTIMAVIGFLNWKKLQQKRPQLPR